MRQQGEARFIDFITDQGLVNNIIKYSDESPELKRALGVLKYDTKVRFLKQFLITDNISFNKFSNNPKLLNYWERYFNDQLLRSDFILLNNSKQLAILEKYGNCSVEIFNNIKYNPKLHLDHLLKFKEPIHDIEYFIKRRGEMLLPNFQDAARNGQLYRPHEIDSFIKLEIDNAGKARASLKGEAGDIVMEGGSLNGKSLDPLGITSDFPQIVAKQPDVNRYYTNWLGEYVPNKVSRGFLGSIHHHFEKIYSPAEGHLPLDIVVIDYNYLDKMSVTIGQPSNYLRLYIDNFILTNFAEYNNSNYLIKLNY